MPPGQWSLTDPSSILQGSSSVGIYPSARLSLLHQTKTKLDGSNIVDLISLWTENTGALLPPEQSRACRDPTMNWRRWEISSRCSRGGLNVAFKFILCAVLRMAGLCFESNTPGLSLAFSQLPVREEGGEKEKKKEKKREFFCGIAGTVKGSSD